MPTQPVSKTTPSLTDEQLEVLRILLPQAFTEGRIDPEKLLASLGELIDDRPERYSFSWAGKRDAIRLLQAPSRATLTPARDEALDFDATQNLFIEGDNLEVLKLLYKPYFGRVKMIYIDPPYNTGNDFVYPDNFADPLDTYLQLTGQKDSAGNLLTSNPEPGGRYHSTWLSMMYPRLFLARQLLREDGVIFVSIDDHEVHNLRLLMNEIFGEENFVASIVWQKKYAASSDDQGIASMHDYILVYSRSDDYERGLLPRTDTQLSRYTNLDNDPRGDWASDNYLSNKSKEQRPTLYYPVKHPRTGKEVWPPEHAVWRYSKSKHAQMEAENRLYWGPKQSYERPRLKRFVSELKSGIVPSTWWPHTEAGHNDEAKKHLAELMGNPSTFSTPKPVRLIKRLLQIGTSEYDDIVLDFFAGSCATTQAVLELNREDGGNRRFIMVQLPEPTGNPQFPTIAEIGKERIRRVIARMNKRREGQLALDKPEDLGFKVFKLAPSNYKQWDGAQPDAAAYARQAELFADPLAEGWQPENLLYEVALKEGYGLNIQVEATVVESVQRVSDPEKGQSFYLTLAGKLVLQDLRPLDLKKDDLFICRDSALDDEAAANLALQCRLKTI